MVCEPAAGCRQRCRRWNPATTEPTPPDPEALMCRLASRWRPAVGHLPVASMLIATKKKLTELRTSTVNYADQPPPKAFQTLFRDLYAGRHAPSQSPPAPAAYADDA